MEKLIYSLWKPNAQPGDAFRNTLLGRIAPLLGERGGARIKVNVADDAVAPAKGLRMVTSHDAPDATVSFWLTSAHDRALPETIFAQAAPASPAMRWPKVVRCPIGRSALIWRAARRALIR